MAIRNYKYITTEEESRNFPELKFLTFKSEWLNINEGFATIKKGYAWNGCSPKVKIFGKVYGTWDGNNDEARYATMWHDAFYQYSLDLQKLEVDRFFVDANFALALAREQFKFPILYFIAVRLFGWITWYNKRKY